MDKARKTVTTPLGRRRVQFLRPCGWLVSVLPSNEDFTSVLTLLALTPICSALARRETVQSSHILHDTQGNVTLSHTLEALCCHIISRLPKLARAKITYYCQCDHCEFADEFLDVAQLCRRIGVGFNLIFEGTDDEWGKDDEDSLEDYE